MLNLNDLEINVRITKICGGEKLKAIASVNFNDCFTIRGLRIYEGKKRPFVVMPNYILADGTRMDVCFPTLKALRHKINDKVIYSYQRNMKEIKRLTESH